MKSKIKQNPMLRYYQTMIIEQQRQLDYLRQHPKEAVKFIMGVALSLSDAPLDVRMELLKE